MYPNLINEKIKVSLIPNESGNTKGDQDQCATGIGE